MTKDVLSKTNKKLLIMLCFSMFLTQKMYGPLPTKEKAEDIAQRLQRNIETSKSKRTIAFNLTIQALVFDAKKSPILCYFYSLNRLPFDIIHYGGSDKIYWDPEEGSEDNTAKCLNEDFFNEFNYYKAFGARENFFGPEMINELHKKIKGGEIFFEDISTRDLLYILQLATDYQLVKAVFRGELTEPEAEEIFSLSTNEEKTEAVIEVINRLLQLKYEPSSKESRRGGASKSSDEHPKATGEINDVKTTQEILRMILPCDIL
jgi:hypothetical protein